MWTYIRDKLCTAGSGSLAGIPSAEGFPHFTEFKNLYPHLCLSVNDTVFLASAGAQVSMVFVMQGSQFFKIHELGRLVHKK